jgi:predicted nucleic acid-binding protein
MRGFLLDTNVLSELSKTKPSDRVEAFLARREEFWLSVVSLHEVAFGLARMADVKRRGRLEAWFGSIKESFADRIIPVDEGIAETAGRVRGALASTGRVIGPLDSIIGATAVVRALTLATRNMRDFEYLNVALVNPWEA